MRALLHLALATAPFALLPGTALAQETGLDSQRVEILGTAPAACVLDAPTAANGVNASFSSGSTSTGQIEITQFVDPASANPVTSSIELALPVICNASHELTVRSGNGGLLRDGGSVSRRQGPTVFADFVTYDVSLDWAGRTVSQRSDAGTMLVVGGNARAGDMALRISTPAGGGPLTAGRFDDTIIVEFRAAN